MSAFEDLIHKADNLYSNWQRMIGMYERERDRHNELKDDFHRSQQAVKYAMKRVDIVYSEGGLSVDDYTSIIEALQQAEI